MVVQRPCYRIAGARLNMPSCRAWRVVRRGCYVPDSLSKEYSLGRSLLSKTLSPAPTGGMARKRVTLDSAAQKYSKNHRTFMRAFKIK